MILCIREVVLYTFIICMILTYDTTHYNQPKTSHNGSNLTSNITHFNTRLLMWQLINEERGVCGNLASYCNITHFKA